MKKRYWKYVATGNIFSKPDYWEPLHPGWVEVSKLEYVEFATRRGLI